MLGPGRPAHAFSVLAHENTVDALWASDIVPLLRQRYRGITDAQLTQARAYAYGGSLIQDLGYYPFGSHLFTNLTHYVRSGDFVESLLRERGGRERIRVRAWRAGALRLRQRRPSAGGESRRPADVSQGARQDRRPVALYVDSPARHVMVEFAFDVLQVAQGGYVAQAYRDRIGFEVSKQLLERAVIDTYAIDLDDLLLNVDLAIGTYRKAVSSTIPEMTRIAWRDKREEIEQRTPASREAAFVYACTRQDYDREFGTKYRKPRIPRPHCSLFCLKMVPKIGPFRPLAFEPLTAGSREAVPRQRRGRPRPLSHRAPAAPPTHAAAAEHRLRHRTTPGARPEPAGR